MGRQAKEIGLADELGGLVWAVDIAAKKAGVAEYQVLTFGAGKGILDFLFGDAAARTLLKILPELL